MGGPDLQRIAPHPEGAPREGHVIAAVLLGHKVGDHLALVVGLARHQVLGHRPVGLDRTDAVDARHRGDDNDVVALQQGPGGGVAHPVDLLVDLGFLLDEGVRAGDIGLGLVIVVIRHEVFNGIFGKKSLELAIKLRRERLVWREDDGRALGGLDDLSDGEGLAGAGGAQQDLVALAALHARDQFGDRSRLIPGWIEIRAQHEGSAAFELVSAAGFGKHRQGVRNGHGQASGGQRQRWAERRRAQVPAEPRTVRRKSARIERNFSQLNHCVCAAPLVS